MKIYLAGPMRGMPQFNFPAFYRYAYELRQQGHEVYNPAEIGISQDNIRAIFARETSWICQEAEAIYLMPGWAGSKGARAERALAEALDLQVDYLQDQICVNNSPSEPESSITFRSRLRKLQESVSPVKDSMELRGGTELSLPTRATLLFVTILSAVLSTAMVFAILQRWLGGH